jgi:lysophospholipase L1-like esterase
MRRRYAGTPNFLFFPTEEIFTLPSGAIKWRTSENLLLYLDDDHITEEGAQLIVRELEPVLR